MSSSPLLAVPGRTAQRSRTACRIAKRGASRMPREALLFPIASWLAIGARAGRAIRVTRGEKQESPRTPGSPLPRRLVRTRPIHLRNIVDRDAKFKLRLRSSSMARLQSNQCFGRDRRGLLRLCYHPAGFPQDTSHGAWPRAINQALTVALAARKNIHSVQPSGCAVSGQPL